MGKMKKVDSGVELGNGNGILDTLGNALEVLLSLFQIQVTGVSGSGEI